MPLQGWVDGLYDGNITGKDGYFKGRGLGAAFLKPFVDEEKLEKSRQRTENKNTATSKGENLDDLDLDSSASTLDVEGAIITKGRERIEQRDKTNYTRQLGVIKEGQGAQLEATRSGERTAKAGIEASLQQSKDQMTLMQEKMFNEARESRLDRAERADQRADDRMMQIEMFERADRKDEKNRRRESIQALVAGLSSLGAAFAV